MEFIIRHERFEGPYTKILELIEERKISISELSLSKIADDYIEYVKFLKTVNPLDISDFILTASTLMLIKVKTLLPNIKYGDDEVKQVKNLEKKILLFKELSDAQKHIENIWGKRVLINKKKTVYKNSFSPSRIFDQNNIYSVAMLTLIKIPSFDRLKEVKVEQKIKLENMIDKILKEVNEGASFKNIAGKEKYVIIVTFLALLELIKSGAIDAEHDGGDIKISKRSHVTI
jgi:segregation and condensation protein A